MSVDDIPCLNMIKLVKVMQGLRNKYPAFSALMSFTEESKKETTSVSRSQSTSGSDTTTLKTKKKGWIERFQIIKSAVNKKVKNSKSYLTEKTVSTDCSTSDLNEKNLVITENESTIHTLELISEGGRTERRFPFSFNLKPWKKKYNVAEL